MTTLADRLRGVVRPVASPPQVSEQRPDTAAEILGGDWRDEDGLRYLVVNRTYASGYLHGHASVEESLPPADGVWPTLPLLEPSVRDGRLLFLDLETTGLAGGAGTYAFLVGCGWFEGATFRTRQFFLSNYTAERALLGGVAVDAAAASGVITYNGKSFDLPLIETRFALQRMTTPFAGLPHVDMLHPARRLWRRDDHLGEATGCRLTMLEETLCGHRREGDVPGFEIPSRYFHFVRTGDPRPLEAVLEHNRLDLLALALVTARASRLLGEGAAGVRTAREAVGLGRLYERAGLMVQAAECYERAGDVPGDVMALAEALRAYALLLRRGRRYDAAADAWSRLLELPQCPPIMAREASEALAVHHEHRARDLEQARRFAVQSLQFEISEGRQAAIRHRLARIDRKIGEPLSSLY